MSVEKAKEAVQCDVKDGISWCKLVITDQESFSNNISNTHLLFDFYRASCVPMFPIFPIFLKFPYIFI